MKTPSTFLLLTVCTLGLSGFSSRLQAAPERVLIIGDSMMQVTAHATTLALDKRSGVTSKSQTSLGSGLARLDVYDWMGEADSLVKEFNPDVTMVWIGTNDQQAMQTTDQGTVQLNEKAWEEEYARRVGLLMDKLTVAKGSKVYWLELPVMRDEKMTEEVAVINRIAKAEADKRDQVEFFPTGNILTRKPGVYSPILIGNTGRPIKVREVDGIHLSREGADRVAESFVKTIFN
ncbi:MAG: DUF459 domain-containing protein [Kiritimatiellae bacterium]|jgi:hypothetical protein|nr:DUF459 domain-containing protein [Kiritimatiellia bacterium]